MRSETINILLVEDDELDVEAVERAFEELKIANPITLARDGVEALEMLRGEAGREKFPRPFLILLDLNMPRMNGIEFLQNLRADPDLTDSVVFVLTTSKSEQDKVAAYNSHVAGYIIKSDIGNGFLKLVEMLDNYWRVVELPSKKE